MIDIERITLIEKENKYFIRYMLSIEETVSKTELEMLKNNDIQGILNISEIWDDDNIVFLYNVTSKIQLSKRFTAAFSGEQVYNMLQSLCRIWMCTDEYMLDRKHFVMYPELMCIDQETSELYVMVLPINAEEDDMEIGFHRILTGIFQSLFYNDMAMPDFCSHLQEYSNHHISLTAKDFLDFLEQTYQEEQGILNPVSEAPNIPEYVRENGKEILHEEEAKKLLQSRCKVQQNDEEDFLKDTAKEENSIFKLSEKGKIGCSGSLKAIKGKPAIENIPIAGNKKVGKNSFYHNPSIPSRKEKKTKKEKNVPVLPQSIPEKEESQMKKKKGLFHGLFGGKKEKETKEEQKQTAEPAMPTLVTEVNQNGIPAQKWQNPYQKSINNGQDFYQQAPIENLNLAGNRMQQGRNLIGYEGLVGRNKNNGQRVQQGFSNSGLPQYSPWSLNFGSNNNVQSQPATPKASPEQRTMINEREIDLDATILTDSGIDLDATTLTGMEEHRVICIPVLRSRETGEIIKITHSDFLVGRQKMRDGKVIHLPGVKQPDLILTKNNVSHIHANFTLKDGQWYITDQKSLNGTFVNEERLVPQQERALTERDILRFASEEYEYLIITE